jgi:predicted Zn-dependent protease
VDIFQGLTDTKIIDERTALLDKNTGVREGQEREKKELDEQAKLQDKILNILQLMHKPKPKWLTGEQLNNYDEGGFTFGDLRSQARDAIRQLQKDIESKNRPESCRVLERVRSVISIYLTEAAQLDMDSNDLLIAKNFFELAAEAQPGKYGPHLSLARCLVRLGEKKESIHELGRARALGLSPQELFDLSKQLPELSPMIGDPDFQKLIQDSPPGH